jgi:hypothetical protein
VAWQRWDGWAWQARRASLGAFRNGVSAHGMDYFPPSGGSQKQITQNKMITTKAKKTERNGDTAVAATDKPTVETKMVLPKMNLQIFQITLIGDSALICHRWSEKAKKEMRDKQMKRAKAVREAKNPERDYKESLYEHPEGGYGFPAVAFKAAAVDACSQIESITKVEARGAFHIQGDMVKIEGKPNMREDMVRVGMGAADLRYRGEFKQWSCTLTIRHNADVLSAEQIVNLFNHAGFAVGVGEWRPQKDGSFGMFHVGEEGETK